MVSMIRKRRGCEIVDSDLFSLLIKACEDDNSVRLDESELMGNYTYRDCIPLK